MFKSPFRGRETEELDPSRLQALSAFFRPRSQPLLQPRARQQRLPHTNRYSALMVKAMVISFTIFAIAVVLFGLWLQHH